jgi:hypothetical protein
VPLAHLMAHDEPERAGRVIAELGAGPRSRATTPPASVAAFSRREIARRYAALLDEIAGDRGPPDSGERPSVAHAPE